MATESSKAHNGIGNEYQANNRKPPTGNGIISRERKTLQEYWISAQKRARERFKRGEPEMPTGIGWIDALTDGINRGQLWTISAKTGFGKTSLALSIARNIAEKNKSVLFISLEMVGEELVSRMFCQMSGYDHNELRLGVFNSEFESKNKTFGILINAIDFEVIEYGYRPKDVFDILKELYPNKKPDVIFIDFLQLIDKSSGDERIALENYIRSLAELAKSNNLSIVFLSQLRRLPSGADYMRVPDLVDMKGTGLIEQLSYCVLIIYKEIIQGINGKKMEKIMLKLAKNRGGPVGEKEMIFHGATYKFTEALEKQPEQEKTYDPSNYDD